MSRIKPTVDFMHAWQHPDEVADEVEEELRFHVQKRTQANIEEGMKPDEALAAARHSFGDFNRIKLSCCEIKRGFPFDLRVLRMGLYIAIACLAGGFAIVTINLPHHDLLSVFWQLAAIAVSLCAFLIGRRKSR
jgi:hypothetical protein